MKIVHHVGLTAREHDRDELGAIGISVPIGLAVFDVAESDESWPAVTAWIKRRRPSDFVWTEFTDEEIDSARWVGMRPAWHHGYPQPHDEEFGYLRATYDLSDYCAECGVGLKQIAPFQMKGEPRWGRRAILQLNWVFDEFFVTPEVATAIFEPLGVRNRPVTDRKGNELLSVVQLVINELVDLAVDGLPMERCPGCGRVKYLPVARGFLPPPVEEPAWHALKSRQYFGSGASAFRQVIVSHSLADALRARRIEGASYVPCQPVDAA